MQRFGGLILSFLVPSRGGFAGRLESKWRFWGAIGKSRLQIACQKSTGIRGQVRIKIALLAARLGKHGTAIKKLGSAACGGLVRTRIKMINGFNG